MEQKTGMWKEVPGWAGLIIFICVLWLLGVMEGLQIALVELKRANPESYKDIYPTAYRPELQRRYWGSSTGNVRVVQFWSNFNFFFEI